jgi:hypothetical protein
MNAIKKTVLIHVKIDQDTHESLIEESQRNYRTINNTVLLILHNHYKKQIKE